MATGQRKQRKPGRRSGQAQASNQGPNLPSKQTATQSQTPNQSSNDVPYQSSNRASSQGSRKRRLEEISSNDGEPEPHLVTFVIGPKNRHFTIAASALMNLSDTFKAEYDPQFRDPEADDPITQWPAESVTLFEYFQRWIYSSSVLDHHQTVDDISWETLLCLYSFGINHEILTFVNRIIDTFIDKSEIGGMVPTHLIHRIYQATQVVPQHPQHDDFPPEDLRKWIVHKTCAVRKKSWFNTDAKKNSYPDKFLFDMLHEESPEKLQNRDLRAYRQRFHVTVWALSSDEDIVRKIWREQGRRVTLLPPRVREETTSEERDW